MTTTYAPPFAVPSLSYGEAVRLAHDTGLITSTAGPLLETVIDMLDELKRPDSAFDCLQIAGTNGKSSTARFSAAILAKAGKHTALYTSPELVDVQERMEVNEEVISRELFAYGVAAAYEAGVRVNTRRKKAGEEVYQITPFDLLTVAALVIFACVQVEVAVLEVGMGGRWDATSATDPSCVAITGIGLDHTRILGSSLQAIAAEKAAIIKAGRKVILGEAIRTPEVAPVIEARCAACGVTPHYASYTLRTPPRTLGQSLEFETSTPRAHYRCALTKPAYQVQNAACAIALVEAYMERSLTADLISQALCECPTPGRFDMLRAEPLLLLDACHNPQSCEQFVQTLSALLPVRDERPVLLCAMLADKDVSAMLRTLVPAFPAFAVVATSSSRSLPAAELGHALKEELVRAQRSDVPVQIFENVAAALAAYDTRPLIAAGTISLAGEITALMRT